MKICWSFAHNPIARLKLREKIEQLSIRLHPDQEEFPGLVRGERKADILGQQPGWEIPVRDDLKRGFWIRPIVHSFITGLLMVSRPARALIYSRTSKFFHYRRNQRQCPHHHPRPYPLNIR